MLYYEHCRIYYSSKLPTLNLDFQPQAKKFSQIVEEKRNERVFKKIKAITGKLTTGTKIFNSNHKRIKNNLRNVRRTLQFLYQQGVK